VIGVMVLDEDGVEVAGGDPCPRSSRRSSNVTEKNGSSLIPAYTDCGASRLMLNIRVWFAIASLTWVVMA
jgi:hypothetical protein